MQVLGKVARSYSPALPTAPQSTPVLLSRHRLPCGAESSTATAPLLINRDSSAPLFIMQELPVSGGAPQQKLHCFCISDTASAGVMGIHADKAFWLFVILKRRPGAEQCPSQGVHPGQRREKPVLCLSGTLPCLFKSSLKRGPG